MIWMFLLAVVLGAVFFKLGVYSVVFGLVQLLAKVLFVVSGARQGGGTARTHRRSWQAADRAPKAACDCASGSGG
jgi:hypothetical protein